MPDEPIEPPIPQEIPAAALPPAAAEEFEKRIARLEDRFSQDQLSHEAQTRDLLIAEIRQRLRMRRAAIVIAVMSILFMAFLLFYAPAKIRVPQAATVALYLGPIISITTLAVVLIVGSFRRFKDEDLSNVSVGSLAAEAARSSTS